MSIRHTSFALLLFVLLCLLPPQGRAQMVYMPEGDVAGTNAYYKVKKKDTLYSIARQFDVGIVELLAANPGIDPWIPKAGTRLTIPAVHVLPPPGMREGIVINLSALRLYYFYDPHTVMSFPVGIGMDGWITPTGVTSIVKKRKDPTWTPPDSIREENPDLPDVVPAGPDNPLGAYAMNLGLPGYLIHGTNHPYGIGKRSSHGCIRLYPEDISLLFDIVKEGTPVKIIDMPYTLGWRGNSLYLQVSPSPEQADKIAQYKQIELLDLPDVYHAVEEAAGNQAKINWPAVKDAVIWRTGIPVLAATKED